MNSKDSLKNVISSLNKGKTYPALQLVQSSPETAAMISKLVAPADKSGFNLQNKNPETNLNQSQIQAVSESTKQRIIDNESIVQIFPDIELAVQILVSSILSPKDMVNTDIIYKSKDPIFASELLMKLNTIASAHVEGYHKLRDELQEILRDTLFETGSYIKAVIPESIVDEIINQNKMISTESLSDIFVNGDSSKIKSLNILGNAGPATKKGLNAALESFFNKDTAIVYNPSVTIEDGGKKIDITGLEVTDNIQLLKLPKVSQVAVTQMVNQNVRKKKVNVSTEALDLNKKLSSQQMTTISYKNNAVQTQNFLAIPATFNAKRKSIGRPLVLRLPSEAVIPVYIPGNEKKHIGYFVLVDAEGNPLNRNSTNTSGDTLAGLAGLSQGTSVQNASLSSMLLNKAKRNLVAADAVPTVDNITKVYSSIVEGNLMERLANGIYGSNVQISNNEEVYRIMLARSLSSKYTRLIYLPAELTTYFAFNHYANGVGKSYLDSIKNLTSLRAMLLFAKVMAQVKSAISLTHVGVTLDPRDPDPMKTIEMAQHEIAKMRQQYFPLGINTPVDLVNWIQRAGIEMSFEGHPGIPSTKFDFETKNMQRDVPDSELDEMLRKQTYMAFGLSPETVDNGFNSEFATTAVANNILLSKRVIQIQEKFSPQLSEFARKLLFNDAIAMEELTGVLEENIGLIEKGLSDEEKLSLNENKVKFLEDTVVRYLDNLELTLPKPDITSLKNQSEAYSEYSDALDKAIDSWISSEFLTSDLAGEINSNIDSVKATVKAHYLRRWMAENGYMSELNDIVTLTEDGKPTLDIYDMNKNHMEGVIRSSLKFIQNIQPMVNASNSDLQKLNIGEGSPDTSSSDDGSSSSGGDFGSDFDLGGDFGGGSDTPPEEPVDEIKIEETTETSAKTETPVADADPEVK